MRPEMICLDPRCGWEVIQTARYGLPWFPCRGAVNCRNLQWPSPVPVERVDLTLLTFGGAQRSSASTLVESLEICASVTARMRFDPLGSFSPPDHTTTSFLDELWHHSPFWSSGRRSRVTTFGALPLGSRPKPQAVEPSSIRVGSSWQSKGKIQHRSGPPVVQKSKKTFRPRSRGAPDYIHPKTLRRQRYHHNSSSSPALILSC
jgi:hypothetical protein